jgi:hypothetical protein
VTASPDTDLQPVEVTAIADLEDELRVVLPDVDDSDITSVVDRVWDSFRNAKVRDFVPVLVRRQVLDELRSPAGRGS